MARHKEFDRDEALHKAMEVFWSRGYEAASVNDLVRHMGINRQSLYDTFGDKHALYLQALDRYREVEGRRMFEILDRPGSVKKALRQLFQGVVEGSFCDGQRRGCGVHEGIIRPPMNADEDRIGEEEWPQKSTRDTKRGQDRRCLKLNLLPSSSDFFLCVLCLFAANLPLS